jgi:two-component system, OmpR family, phosphate regulon sensor histidine kinase PhoR
VKSSKQLWTIILMTSSILLLLVLQLLWLRSAYHDELESFRKETNSLFRSTILNLHDSLIIKSIEPMVGTRETSTVMISRDSARVEILNSRVERDTVNRNLQLNGRPRLRFRDTTTQLQIFVSAPGSDDSVRKLLRPIVSEFRRNRQSGNFVFRWSADSLNISDIQKNYRDTLTQSGITLIPVVQKINLQQKDSLLSGTFYTDPFFLPHTPAYRAYFENISPMLLAKISPQIMFSVLLTVLTITAFLFMYRSIQTQEKLMQLKNDLISNITHELKTPVATVSVALEALKNFKALDSPERTQEYLAIAQNELGRLSLITDKILRTAVFEQNGIELKTEPVALDKIIQHVLTSFTLVFEKQQAQVDFIKEEMDYSINGNNEHLTNVIYNLLDNALKYSGQGCQITVRLKKLNSEIQLIVNDNGIGISTEYHEKVFDKFFRVPTGNVHNAKGYGLGLSYVASVIKSHGGTITVNSEPGKGSIFSITLPLPEAP